MGERHHHKESHVSSSSSDDDKDKIHAMLEFGIQGKAELSSITVAVAIGFFGILTILNGTIQFQLTWISLSIAYWALYLFSVWAFANHQMYASVTDTYIKKLNQNFDEELKEIVEPNFLARWMFNVFWKDTPYPKQVGRVLALGMPYTIIILLLWITIAFNL